MSSLIGSYLILFIAAIIATTLFIDSSNDPISLTINIGLGSMFLIATSVMSIPGIFYFIKFAFPKS